MTPLPESILIGLGTGLVSGLITGFYSGLIISRRTKFDSLQAELLRHLNSIEYIQETSHVAIDRGTSNQMIFIACELNHFGHHRAATSALNANKIIPAVLYDAEHGKITTEELSEKIKYAWSMIRNSKPAYKIYLPCGTRMSCRRLFRVARKGTGSAGSTRFR